MKLNLTLWMGVTFVLIAIVRAFGIPLNTFVVVGISVSAVFISVYDLLEEIDYKHLKMLSGAISALVIGFILLPGLFPAIGNQYEDFLKTAGDIATILGLGFVLITIGIKNSQYMLRMMQNFEKLTREKQEKANPKFNHHVVKEMASQEYKTMLSINDIVLELEKRDKSTVVSGRVHDGWSSFYDTLADFQIHRGPFYDLLLDQLFWEFAEYLNTASNYFSTISDSDASLNLGDVMMWGTVTPIHSYRVLPHHKGYKEGVEAINHAIKVWYELKKKATYLHENHGIRE
jgi:hypothetical protein